MSHESDSQPAAAIDSTPSKGVSSQEAAAIIEAWREFDLVRRKEILDNVCVDMREQKVLSMNGRRKLNELTKLFRSKAKDEQGLFFTELLKCYQEEIDQLSKRSKFSESSFYNLYKDLNDLPDPLDCIEGLMEAAVTGSSSQLEIEKLRMELEHYDQEFRQLKNQDITIRRLEDKLVEYENIIDVKVNEKLALKVEEVEERANSKTVELMERQKATEKRMQVALENMKIAQYSADRAQTDLFDMTSQSEIRFSSLLNDQAILQEQLDRNLLHNSQLQEEIAALKVILSSTTGNVSNGDTSSNSKIYEINFEEANRLQNIIESLRNEMNNKENIFANERNKIVDQNSDLIKTVNDLNDKINELKVELSKRPREDDYINVIQKMKILQRIIFNSTESDDYNDEASGIVDIEAYRLHASKVDIDDMILLKVKGLETEIQSSRNDLRKAESLNGAANDKILSLTNQLDSSRALVNRLEDNLQQMSRANNSNSISSDSNKHQKQSASADSTNELAELLGVGSSAAKIAKKVGASSSSSAANGTNSGNMIDILQTQRDRYKERLTQVESLAVSLQNKLSILETEKSKMSEENISLYSKIRYFRDFTDVASPAKSYDRVKGHHDDDEDDIEAKYKRIYEKKMNPFNEFSEREKKRKFNELTVADKIVYNTALNVISTAAGRSLLVLYLGSIHLLVFVILYYVSHHTGYVSCDPSLDHQN